MMDDWLENGSNQNKTDQAKRSASVYGGRVGLNAKHAMDCLRVSERNTKQEINVLSWVAGWAWL